MYLGKMAGLQSLSLSCLSQIFDYLPIAEILKCSGLCKALHEKIAALLRRKIYSLQWELETTEPPISVFIETYYKHLLHYDFKTKQKRCFKGVQAVHKVSSNPLYLSVLAHSGQIFSVDSDFSRCSELAFVSDSRLISTSQELFASKSAEGILTLTAFSPDQGPGDVFTAPFPSVSVVCCSDVCLCGTEDGQVFIWNGKTETSIELRPPNSSRIKDIKTGSNFSLILTGEGKVYNLAKGTDVATQVPELRKAITQIAVGRGFCVVLQRKEYPPLDSWSTEMLIAWLEEQDFSELVPLARNSQLTGSDIEITDQYLLDTLGLRKVDQKWRMKTILEQAVAGFVESEYELYGWGMSTKGQLGVTSKVKRPSKLPHPPLSPNESISELVCNTNSTIVSTSASRIFGIGECNESPNWTDLTSLFLDPSNYRIFSMSSSFSAITLVVGLRKTSQVHRKRLKGADKVLNRLLWDPALNRSEFILGFEDRFLGIIEQPIQEFLARDIPSHRIKYFKRNGELVWDRSTKLDSI